MVERIPGVRIVLLQKVGRRRIIWKYINVNSNNKISLGDSPGTIFQVQALGTGIVLAVSKQNGYLSTSPDSEFVISSLNSALQLDLEYGSIASNSALQIDVAKLPPQLQNTLANSGSFAFLLVFSEKIFRTSQKMSSTIGTGTLDETLTTQAACEATNGYWDGTALACYTCVAGSSYPDRTNLTCIDCPLGAACGDGYGYCNGSTGNSDVPCNMDSVTKKFTPSCSGAKCGGQCTGSCSGSVFGWTCQFDSSSETYQCKFDKSQWWKLFLWILFFLILLIILIWLVVKILKPKKPKVDLSPQSIGVGLPHGVETGIEMNQPAIAPQSYPVQTYVQQPSQPSVVIREAPPQNITIQQAPANPVVVSTPVSSSVPVSTTTVSNTIPVRSPLQYAP